MNWTIKKIGTKKYVPPKEVADYLGVTEPCLCQWRQKTDDNNDLPYIRLGGSIYYDLDGILSFVDNLGE